MPTSILNSWGIYYFPNKYYAIAFPTWSLVTVVSGILLYVSVAMIHCHPKDSFKTMQDYASVLSKPKDADIQHDNTAETSTITNDSPTNRLISPRHGVATATLKKSTSVFLPNTGSNNNNSNNLNNGGSNNLMRNRKAK